MKKLMELVLGKRDNSNSVRDKAIMLGMQDATKGLEANPGGRKYSPWNQYYMMGYNHIARGIV